jgi:hypothetical protein
MPKKSANTAVAVVNPMTGKEVALKVEGLKVKRRVTVPLKLLQTGEQFTFRAEGEVSGGEEGSARKGFDKAMTILPCMNLEDGEFVSLIVPTVLESALKRVPGGYVGKSFCAIQGPKMPGKRYHQVELFELEQEA